MEYFKLDNRIKDGLDPRCKKCASKQTIICQRNNPKIYIAKSQRHRARKLNAKGTHTGQDIIDQYNRQLGLCAYCCKLLTKGYAEEHVIPLSRGGSNAPDNLVIACPTCNSSKGVKLLEEWLPEEDLIAFKARRNSWPT
jgi:5-methylcytosine-specific restriction endonuclease McrA